MASPMIYLRDMERLVRIAVRLAPRVAIVACALAISPGGIQAVEIIAHRGASFDAPENTLPAVLLGWERGADAVEVDIHLTADGKVAVFHDKTTQRITGQPGVVAELSLAHLRTLDAGEWKDPRWKGTRIPSLDEVLETIPSGKRLVVEIKGRLATISPLERALDNSGMRSRVMLIAFDYETIVAAKERMGDLPCYWLYGHSSREDQEYGVLSPSDLIARVDKAGLDGLDVRHDGPWIGDLARMLAERGKDLYVYTVNSPDRARDLRDLGVTGITTDRPAYIRTAVSGP